MKEPSLPKNEDQRLAALKNLEILDTLPEQQFDDLTSIAASICQAPIALISLIDENRQWFKSKHGIATNETPRKIAFCAHAINEVATFIVPDSLLDDRFRDNPLVTGGPRARFYAGAQLVSSDGFNLGTLCVIDHQPRKLSSDQVKALEALSRTVVALIEKSLKSKELERKSKFLVSVMSALPNLVAYLDREFRFQYANTAYQTWFGLEADSIIGKKIGDVFGEELFTIGRQYMERALAGNLVEFQRQLPYVVDGKSQPRTVRVNYIPDLDRNGAINGIFAIVTDLSDKTIALEKLESREREVQRVFDALPAMIGHWGLDQLNLSANQAYSKFFGKSPELIKGMHMRDVLGAEVYQQNLPFIRGALAGKPQTFERKLELPDGTPKFTLASYLPDVEGGVVKGFFVIVSDITELKTIENEREALLGKMTASAKLAELGEMAGGIAHEINNPLASIIGRIGLMQDRVARKELDPETLARDLAKIETTTARIAKIVAGLRALSRNADNDPPSEVSVETIVENTLELCRERFRHSGVDLRVNMPQGLTIQCRESQISQILINLLGNSLDAVRDLPEKWVSMDVEETADTVRFFVTDSGHGIPEKVAAKIMHPFFTTKEIGKGTGLGLSISFGLAKAHGGNLFYVKESPNTKFCLELPMLARLPQAS